MLICDTGHIYVIKSTHEYESGVRHCDISVASLQYVPKETQDAASLSLNIVDIHAWAVSDVIHSLWDVELSSTCLIAILNGVIIAELLAPCQAVSSDC